MNVKIVGEGLLTLQFRVFAVSEEILTEENLGFIGSGKGGGNPAFSFV